MQFFLNAKQVTGRKKLQKMIYILQSLGVPFEEKYQFHFYGPYSEELSLRVEELCNLGFLDEEKENKSSYFQYHYKVTGDGEEFLHQFALDMPDYGKQIEMMQNKSARFLELVSTMLYFHELSKEEVEQKIHVVKPKQKYTEDEIKEAWEFIDSLSVGLAN